MGGVHIRDARDADDANAQAKRSEAYRQILRDHPSKEWNRRHVRTARHWTGPEVSRPAQLDGPGAWMVEFEVTRKS